MTLLSNTLAYKQSGTPWILCRQTPVHVITKLVQKVVQNLSGSFKLKYIITNFIENPVHVFSFYFFFLPTQDIHNHHHDNYQQVKINNHGLK